MGQILFLTTPGLSDTLQFARMDTPEPAEAVSELARPEDDPEPCIDVGCCSLLVATVAAWGLAFGCGLVLCLDLSLRGGVVPLMAAMCAGSLSIALHLTLATFLYRVSLARD